MKTYVITLSQQFPAGHMRAGEPTMFHDRFLLGIGCPDCSTIQDLSGENISPCNSCQRACLQPKVHTIRANYPLWEMRIAKVEKGDACLSIRKWTGKPYRSPQVEIARLTKEDGVGIQELVFDDTAPDYCCTNDGYIPREDIARNDGLSREDWEDWFKIYDKSQPMAIIHFTDFRY